MQVNLDFYGVRNHVLDTHGSDTIGELKTNIESLENISKEEMIVVHCGKILDQDDF